MLTQWQGMKERTERFNKEREHDWRLPLAEVNRLPLEMEHLESLQ